MKESDRYPKLVAWSEEDQCYIGAAPGLIFGGCCHGDDQKAVFNELVEIVEEVIADFHKRGEPLPPAVTHLAERFFVGDPVAAE